MDKELTRPKGAICPHCQAELPYIHVPKQPLKTTWEQATEYAKGGPMFPYKPTYRLVICKQCSREVTVIVS